MYDDALYYYNKALDIVNSKKILNLVSNTKIDLNRVYLYTNISRIYSKQGNYDKARSFLNEITQKYIDFSNIDSERYYAYVAIELGELLIKEKEISNAYPLLIQAINIGRKNHHRIIIHRAELALVEYYYLNNQKELARPLLDKIREEVKNWGDFKNQLKALEILIIYSNEDSPKYFQEYLEINKLFNGETTTVRSNFVRIKDETNLLIETNKQLNNRNKQLKFMGVILSLVLGCILLLYIYQSHNKKIRLVKIFQKDTEQYYDSILNIQNSLNQTKYKERNDIAKELNDGVMNRLFAARFSLIQLDQKNIMDKKELLINEIVEVENYIREVSHSISNESSIKINDFEQLLTDLVLANKKQYRIDFKISFDKQLNLNQLSYQKKINIYRCIQEILLNVNLHSEASLCSVDFKYKTPTFFEIRIVDNGKGFDSRTIKRGNGLKNINQRIKLIKGKFIIISKQSRGTTCLFIISTHTKKPIS